MPQYRGLLGTFLTIASIAAFVKGFLHFFRKEKEGRRKAAGSPPLFVCRGRLGRKRQTKRNGQTGEKGNRKGKDRPKGTCRPKGTGRPGRAEPVPACKRTAADTSAGLRRAMAEHRCIPAAFLVLFCLCNGAHAAGRHDPVEDLGLQNRPGCGRMKCN